MNISPSSVERERDVGVTAGAETFNTSPRACLATLPE
jgi:hypothetical protein